MVLAGGLTAAQTVFAHPWNLVDVMLYERGPDPAAEAMGGERTAQVSAAFAPAYNPARLASVEGQEYALTFASATVPEDRYESSLDALDHRYIGAAMALTPTIAVGLAWQHLTLDFPEPSDPEFISPPDPTADRFMLGLAGRWGEGVALGGQVAYVKENDMLEAEDASAVLLDAGIAYGRPIREDGRLSLPLRVGVSVANIGRASLREKEGDMGSVLRAGIALPIRILPAEAEDGAPRLLAGIAADHRDILNDPYHSRTQIGLEVTGWGMVTGRLGWVWLDEPADADVDDSDFTFGVGLDLPLGDYFQWNRSVDVGFEFGRVTRRTLLTENSPGEEEWNGVALTVDVH